MTDHTITFTDAQLNRLRKAVNSHIRLHDLSDYDLDAYIDLDYVLETTPAPTPADDLTNTIIAAGRLRDHLQANDRATKTLLMLILEVTKTLREIADSLVDDPGDRGFGVREALESVAATLDGVFPDPPPPTDLTRPDDRGDQ